MKKFGASGVIIREMLILALHFDKLHYVTHQNERPRFSNKLGISEP